MRTMPMDDGRRRRRKPRNAIGLLYGAYNTGGRPIWRSLLTAFHDFRWRDAQKIFG